MPHAAWFLAHLDRHPSSNASANEGRTPAVCQMQRQIPNPKHPHHIRQGNKRSSGHRENFSVPSPNPSSSFSSGTFPVAQMKSGKYINRSFVLCISHQRAKPSRRKKKKVTWKNLQFCLSQDAPSLRYVWIIEAVYRLI